MKKKIEIKESETISLYVIELINIIFHAAVFFAVLFGMALIIILPWIMAFYVEKTFGLLAGVLVFTFIVFTIYIILRRSGIIKGIRI